MQNNINMENKIRVNDYFVMNFKGLIHPYPIF